MRSQPLDFLRGLAVVLVLFRHQQYMPALSAIGWLGVDLFFVLSGFLVSGLLFRQYLNDGNIRPVNFLIRRGFKIYPLYFAFLAAWLLHCIFRQNIMHEPGFHYKANLLYGQVLFIQNYYLLRFGPTWTLAIEEHFYILLAIGLFICSLRTGLLKSSKTAWAISAILVLVLAGRMYFNNLVLPYQPNPEYYTHRRIDSLLAGVLLSWFWHFKQAYIQAFAAKYTLVLVAIGILPFALAFNYSFESGFMQGAGLCLVYIGFTCLLLWFITSPSVFKLFKMHYISSIMRAFALLGVYSYAIYLFHIIMLDWRLSTAIPHFDWSFGSLFSFCLYFAVSIGGGITASAIIEKPILKLRDKWAPAKPNSKNSAAINYPDQQIKA
ncbi:MAG: acyltransferase [Bacteroidota bacterium]